MTFPSKLAYRGLVTVLAVLTLIAQATAMRAGAHGLIDLQPSALPVLGMGVLDSVAAALAALILVWGTGGHRGTHALAVCMATWGYVLAYGELNALFRPMMQGPVRVLFDAHFPLVEAMGLAAAVRFSALFPSPVLPRDIASPAHAPPGLRTLQRVRRALLGSSAPWVAAMIAFALLLTLHMLSGGALDEVALDPFAQLIRFAAFAVVVLNLRISWIRTRGADRTSMLWAMVGLAFLFGSLGILIGGNVLLAVTGWSIPLLNWRPVVLDLSLLGLLWGTTMGALYRGRLDPARVGRQVALWCGAITVMLFFAAGLEALFADVLLARHAVPAGFGTALSAVLTTLAYTRGRRSLEGSLAHFWSSEPPTPAH